MLDREQATSLELQMPVHQALDSYTLRKWRELLPGLTSEQLKELRQLLLQRDTRYGVNARFERMDREELLYLLESADHESGVRLKLKTQQRFAKQQQRLQSPWTSSGYEHLSPHRRFGVVESSQKNETTTEKGESDHVQRPRQQRTSRLK